MKVFDENGNFLGEFIEESKDRISTSFDESNGNGCITFLYMIPIIIIVTIIWFIFIGIIFLGKCILRILWWIIRVHFALELKRNGQSFNLLNVIY